MSALFCDHLPVFERRNRQWRLIVLASAGAAFSIFILLAAALSFGRESSDPLNNNAQAAGTTNTPPLSTVALLAPFDRISVGAAMGSQKLIEVYWPRNSVPEGAILNRAEIAALYAAQDLAPQQPLTRAVLSSSPPAVSLPLAPGMRGVAISVNSESGNERWALPGNRVDVIFVRRHSNELSTSILCENVRIVSTEGSSESPGSRGSNVNRITTVTIEVTREDMLRIETAREVGSLRLALRPKGDPNTTGPVSPVTEEDLLRGRSDKPVRLCQNGRIKVAGQSYRICDGELVLENGES